MTGMAINYLVVPDPVDIIALPDGSDLFSLPVRKPIGYDPASAEFIQLDEYGGREVFAAAAFMAPAYVQLYRSAYTADPHTVKLPLYAYTAIGWQNHNFCVAGIRIDADPRQDHRGFNSKLIEKCAHQMAARYPKNRLIQHLMENCVHRYGCPAARNLALGRWECPVPTSPSCNADCVGCISKQPGKSGVCASQDRLQFIPTIDEIVDFTVPHLENAEGAIISFGQGCEGEPLMVSELLEAAIKAIRRQTPKGIINLNTNASLPIWIERLFIAGLDSIRVSMNSARAYYYQCYHQPKNYCFDDVLESLQIARRLNRWSSLNYFIFPGFTDHREEVAALEKMLAETRVNMIQARNLNMDPEWYIDVMNLSQLSTDFIGIRNWIKRIRKKFPEMIIGYFNPPAEKIHSLAK